MSLIWSESESIFAFRDRKTFAKVQRSATNIMTKLLKEIKIWKRCLHLSAQNHEYVGFLLQWGWMSFCGSFFIYLFWHGALCYCSLMGGVGRTGWALAFLLTAGYGVLMIVGCWVLGFVCLVNDLGKLWFVSWQWAGGISREVLICVPRYLQASSFRMEYDTAFIIKNRCQTIRFNFWKMYFYYFYDTTE